MKTSASFKTDNASRYLKMLCDHFGRKVKADCDADKGWVQFQIGRCDMAADASKLDLLASADDGVGLNQVVQIMTSHLERFAFRENPNLTWHASPE